MVMEADLVFFAKLRPQTSRHNILNLPSGFQYQRKINIFSGCQHIFAVLSTVYTWIILYFNWIINHIGPKKGISIITLPWHQLSLIRNSKLGWKRYRMNSTKNSIKILRTKVPHQLLPKHLSSIKVIQNEMNSLNSHLSFILLVIASSSTPSQPTKHSHVNV